MTKVKHIGFKAAANKIAKKQGVSKSEASAILASASRRNSKTSTNKRLKKVK